MISSALNESSFVCTALVNAKIYDSVENVVGENVVMVVIVVASGGMNLSKGMIQPTLTYLFFQNTYVL